MKAGDIIPMTDADISMLGSYTARIDAFRCALSEIAEQFSTAQRELWRYVREAHPEINNFEINFNIEKKEFIVGPEKK